MKHVEPLRNTNGFTLVEMAIVVAIIAILAAIAIPDYQRTQALAKRSEGIMYLNQFKISEINYFLDQNTYTLDPGAISSYGIVPNISDLHYYGQRILHSNDPKLGYLTLINGQLDNDPSWDILSLKGGDPGGVWNNYPEGIAVQVDDIIL